MLCTPSATVNACTLAPMPTFTVQSGRASWIALVAIAALVAGIAIAWQQARPPRPVERGAAADEPSEQVIDQALEQTAPIDSAAFKQRWLDDVRGVDASDLDAPRRELFLRHANAGQCTCGCGYTLAGCRASDMTCDVSGARIQALLDSIRAGHITSARGIRVRPRDGG
jgi:hypothetical protein